MMDILEAMDRGEQIEFEGKTFVRVGSTFPLGILVVELGVPFPAPVMMIPLPEKLRKAIEG